MAKAKPKFDRFVEKKGAAECWPWIGVKTAGGYGWFYVGVNGENRPATYAHRAALFYAGRRWGRVARHACDNPVCVNPTHLEWGTSADNSADAVRRKRAYVGEANSNATITDDQVRQIRHLRTGGLLYREIGDAIGTSMSTAWRVCNGGWSHVVSLILVVGFVCLALLIGAR